MGPPDDIARSLPARYLAALEAFVAGESDEQVAGRIGIDPAAARTAVRLAAAKLLAATAEAGHGEDLPEEDVHGEDVHGEDVHGEDEG